MIYFDNAATGGFKPEGVRAAVAAALKTCANPGRSGHSLSLACMERVYSCRKLLCEFFGGSSYERVIFTSNCTHALNLALLGGLSAGDRVVSTVAEHNSVLRPLEYLKGRGVEVEYAPLAADKNVDIYALSRLVDDNTCAVVITLASNVTGVTPDIALLRSLIPQNVLLICDGAQACGHFVIDMQKSGIDALCVAGHKGMYGIQGSGALLLSSRFSPKSVLFGGTGSESNNLSMPDFYPDALEAGTLNYPAVCSLAEGALYLSENLEKDKESLKSMIDYLHAGLEKLNGVTLYSRPNTAGIIAFAFDRLSSEEGAYILSEEYGVCVRGGLHCAPLMHAALKSGGLVRASLSPFNTPSECEKFLCAVRKIARKKA